MKTTTSLYETCEALFADYPLAINDNESMTLMLDAFAGPEFFILIYWAKDGDGDACYDLIRWREADAVARIEAHAGTEDAPAAAGILATATPVPHDGAMFGWLDRGEVTTLISVRASYSRKVPVPTWTPMPRAGTRESEWPPFEGGPLTGSGFWEHYEAGRVVDAGLLVAETPGAVFWVQPGDMEFGCAVVARDVTAPQGWVLPSGAYVYSDTLRSGVSVPSLEDLLADPSKVDLAPRFRER